MRYSRKTDSAFHRKGAYGLLSFRVWIEGCFPKRNNLLGRSYPFPIGRVRKSFHLRDTRLETQTPRNSLQENSHFPFPRDYLKTRTAIDAFESQERRYFFAGPCFHTGFPDSFTYSLVWGVHWNALAKVNHFNYADSNWLTTAILARSKAEATDELARTWSEKKSNSNKLESRLSFFHFWLI